MTSPYEEARRKKNGREFEKVEGREFNYTTNTVDNTNFKIDQLQAEIAKTRLETEAFVKVFGKEHGGFARSMRLGVTPSQLTTTSLTSSSEANEKMKKMQAEIDSLKYKASQVDLLKEQVAFLMHMQNSRESQVIELEKSRDARRSD
ncbi:hypothetical protein QL285_022794 [Trifolium repens]|nr:hypothetical protein QL285_019084 [Trifolium repens]KAK2437964.1 hypothetical protein QL285_022794 [Trifolium repens]